MAKRTGTDSDGSPFKRRKAEDPSKVVYVKGVPPDTYDSELIAIASPYGNILQTLILGQKRQAFIEFDSIGSAAKLIASYPSSAPATLRGAPIYFEYSERTEIKPNPRYGGDPAAVPTDSKFKETPPSTVLLVTVTNMRLPVSVDNLYQVFRTYGDVLRIVTFQKKVFQALIEYPHLASAINAKRMLEGKDIFQNCCSLSISFSAVPPPLKVKSNPLRARDYTTSPATGNGTGFIPPPFHPSPFDHPAPFGSSTSSGGWPSSEGYGYPPAPFLGQGGGGGGLISGGSDRNPEGAVLLVINLPEGKINPDMLFTLFGVYGDVLRVKILWNKKDTALIQFATPQQAALARTHLDKIELIDRKISVVVSKNKEVAPPPVVAKWQNDTTRDYTDSPFHRFNRPGNRNERHVCAPSHSLHVSNLPEDTNVDDLKLYFTSGGEDEGKVLGVKLFGDKKRMAFVHFSTVTDAINALMRYHNQKYGERNIKITFSHQREPREPREGGLY